MGRLASSGRASTWGSLVGSLLAVCLCAQEPKVKKEIPEIAADATVATVLILVFDQAGREIGQGSGFVISQDGKIVTNYHVIRRAATATVKFVDGAFYRVHGVLASDQETDLVVLKLETSRRDFPFLKVADPAEVRVGEQVVAIGSPLAVPTGLLTEGTVSDGIISGVRVEDGLTILQTTAPISPGSSGGPLLNANGEVIAITTARITGGQNLNFGVPIRYAMPLLVDGPVTPLGQSVSGSLAYLAGTYLGIWQSNRGVSGAAAMSVTVEGDTVQAKVALTGSPVGYKGDSIRITVTKFAGNIWTVEFKGEHSALSGTGIFSEDGTFVGDYRYRKLLMVDRGQWILKKE